MKIIKIKEIIIPKQYLVIKRETTFKEMEDYVEYFFDDINNEPSKNQRVSIMLNKGLYYYCYGEVIEIFEIKENKNETTKIKCRRLRK